MLRIALASPPFAGTTGTALAWVERHVGEAAAAGADIVCFPETFVPGLRAPEFQVEDHDPARLRGARDRVCRMAAARGIRVILPMEWPGPDGLLNAAFVISASGEVVGCQTKTQIAPEEEPVYVAGRDRTLFEVAGVPFGIAICHEGWRYPETVRWAATRGARIVFHPTVSGTDAAKGAAADPDADAAGPHPFEMAMACRSFENAIFFASVNNALGRQFTETAVVAPDGRVVARLPRGEPGVLVADIDPEAASGVYAHRLAPERY